VVRTLVRAAAAAAAAPATDALIAAALRELLTNARRHAPGQVADVLVECEGRGVRLTVTTARTDVAPTSSGGGFGLRGLAERVAAAGGAMRVAWGDPFAVTVEVGR
jgi:two-component system sensor histidine kinase DesK